MLVCEQTAVLLNSGLSSYVLLSPCQHRCYTAVNRWSQCIPYGRDIPRQQLITRQRKLNRRRLPSPLQRQPLILHPIPDHRNIAISGESIPKGGHHQSVLKQSPSLRERSIERRIVLLAIFPSSLELFRGDGELYLISLILLQ